jgi:hypothetical protein
MFFRDEDAGEDPEDAVCPFGHEAVMLFKHRLIDAVQVAIRPAARVVDSVKGQVGHEYEFFLVITDLHTGKEMMTHRTYWWADVKDLADRFRNLPAEKAWHLLEKLKDDDSKNQ